MDTLKKVAIVVGIVAGAATIVVAVVTLMMNVATKDDISDLKEQMTTQMTTGFEQVSREISGLRTDVDQKISGVKADVRTNAQNHVNHLAKHNETGGNGKPR